MALAGFNRSNVLKLTLALSLCVGTAHAMASEPDPLKGPKVTDSGVPGETRMFGGGGDGKFEKESILPHRLFMHALDTLRGKDAGTLALTKDQEAQLKAIEDSFRSEMDAYRAQHKDEARQLLTDLPPKERRRAVELLGLQGPRGGRDGERGREGRPPADKARPGQEGAPGERPTRRPEGRPTDGPMGERAPNPEKVEAAKARLKELLEGAPKPDEVHSKVFAVLTSEQKAAVEKKLEAARKEMQQRREEMYKERVKKDIKGKLDEAGPAPDPQKIREFLQTLPKDEREKIQNMPPEERRPYVRKLWDAKNAQDKPTQDKPSPDKK